MRTRRILALLVCVVSALVVLALAGCGGGKKSVPANAIALVGNQPVLRSQFDALMAQQRGVYKAAKKSFPAPGTTEYEQIRRYAVNYLVEQSVFEQEAKKLGVVVTSKQAEKELSLLIKRSYKGDRNRFKKEVLDKRGLTWGDALQSVHTSLLGAAVKKKLTTDVKVSESDIKAYYDKNKSRYKQPESREARHILVKTKVQADKIYAELKAGASFDKLAKKYSLDTTTAKTGGKLPGGVSRGQTVPEFDKVTFLLKTHEISKPVKTSYGWHIIEPLTDTTPERLMPLGEVESVIRQQLTQEKQQKAVDDWVAMAKKRVTQDVTYQVGFAPPKEAVSLLTTTTK